MRPLESDSKSAEKAVPKAVAQQRKKEEEKDKGKGDGKEKDKQNANAPEKSTAKSEDANLKKPKAVGFAEDLDEMPSI
jgi:archaellum component FlaD/FlaE